MPTARYIKAIVSDDTARALANVPNVQERLRRPISFDEQTLNRVTQATSDLRCHHNDIYKVALLEWLAFWDAALSNGMSGELVSADVEKQGRRPRVLGPDSPVSCEHIKTRLPSWPGWRAGDKTQGPKRFWERVMVEAMTLLSDRAEGMTLIELHAGMSAITKLEARMAGERFTSAQLADRIRVRIREERFFRLERGTYFLRKKKRAACYLDR